MRARDVGVKNSSCESLGGQPSSTCPPAPLPWVLGAFTFPFPPQTILLMQQLMAKWNPGSATLLPEPSRAFPFQSHKRSSPPEASDLALSSPLTLSPADKL